MVTYIVGNSAILQFLILIFYSSATTSNVKKQHCHNINNNIINIINTIDITIAIIDIQSIKMGHSRSSLRKSRRSTLPVGETDKDHQDHIDSSDDNIKKIDNRPVKNDGELGPPVRPVRPVPASRSRREDYLSPTSHDDEGVQFGRLRVLCPSGYERNVDITGAFPNLDVLDVLAARALHNAACSPLCRLPEDLLVRIMCHLTWQDIWFLRHVSRVFMRLASCRPELALVTTTTMVAMVLVP